MYICLQSSTDWRLGKFLARDAKQWPIMTLWLDGYILELQK